MYRKCRLQTYNFKWAWLVFVYSLLDFCAQSETSQLYGRTYTVSLPPQRLPLIGLPSADAYAEPDNDYSEGYFLATRLCLWDSTCPELLLDRRTDLDMRKWYQLMGLIYSSTVEYTYLKRGLPIYSTSMEGSIYTLRSNYWYSFVWNMTPNCWRKLRFVVNFY